MTELPPTFSKRRPPWARTPKRFPLTRNPAIWIGAAAMGVLGFFAWRNRERIAARAGPMLENARLRGQTLLGDARTRSQELMTGARDATRALGQRVGRARRGAAQENDDVKLN